MHAFRMLALTCLLATPALAADWQPLRAPGFWEKRFGGVVEEYDGIAWLRCAVTVPAEWKDAGDSLTLVLGAIDDVDETYFNGEKIGGLGTQKPFRTASSETRTYKVPARLVRFGQPNLIAVKVFDGGGAGGLQAGPLNLKTSKAAMDLAGKWQVKLGEDTATGGWPGGNADSEAAKSFIAAFNKDAGDSFGKAVDLSPLPGTKELTMEGDIASELVAGVDKFLLRKLDESIKQRERHWKRDFSSPEAYNKSIEPNRKKLAHILGVRDARVKFDDLELVGTTKQAALVGKGEGYEIYAVRWPVLEDPDPVRTTVTIHGEGLLLVPTGGKKPVADVIAIPDCEQTPEQLVGLVEGVPAESQFARRLAESGCRVIVPMLINRQERMSRLTNREFLYRSAFELGRHLIGYEVQKVLACVDWFEKESQISDLKSEIKDAKPRKIGVIGYGEGGMLALYAGALDTRIDATCVSGYFDSRQNIWQEPLDRNVFGLLDQFGDAEVATLIIPRALTIDSTDGSTFAQKQYAGGRGAPAMIPSWPGDKVDAEIERALNVYRKLGEEPATAMRRVRPSSDGVPAMGAFAFLNELNVFEKNPPRIFPFELGDPPTPQAKGHDTTARHKRQFDEIDQHNQLLLRESPYVRKAFMKKLTDVAATGNVPAYEKAVEEYRAIFKNDVIGAFDDALLPANPRSRKLYEKGNVVAYEVVLDVFPDVIAYGILTMPSGLRPGDKRPVVVCQHGLEGRPQSVIGEKDFHYYKAFATQLAERGFITFAPQNLYIFEDRFRTLQRKANPLGKTLFSIIVPQHQQITDWLKTLPQVDGERIGFYGLSYGGKSAMRIPPLVSNYKLSICSADFNEWVDKNASTRGNYSYVNTGEYEIFEWDLGSTFNYAEMAALIAPRPFMVERGHFDGVGIDEQVAYEYAKVQHLYQAQLKIGDRCEIEWFVGPHSINGMKTYDFLHKWLRQPKP
jgi:dienelactone hydrolase